MFRGKIVLLRNCIIVVAVILLRIVVFLMMCRCGLWLYWLALIGTPNYCGLAKYSIKFDPGEKDFERVLNVCQY